MIEKRGKGREQNAQATGTEALLVEQGGLKNVEFRTKELLGGHGQANMYYIIVVSSSELRESVMVMTISELTGIEMRS